MKKSKLKLGNFYENSGYVTLNQVLFLIYGRNSCAALRNMLLKKGLPIINKKIAKRSVKFVDIDKFWEWAEKNQNSLNFRKLEENILGKEPNWVKQKRNNDILQFDEKNTRKRWTDFEIERLKKYTELGYDLKTIAKELKRSEGAVRRKKYDYYLD